MSAISVWILVSVWWVRGDYEVSYAAFRTREECEVAARADVESSYASKRAFCVEGFAQHDTPLSPEKD